MNLEIDRLRPIRMLVLDVDGVLTDARVWMDSDGQWRRFFSIRDGLGLKMLREAGYRLAIITSSDSDDIRARARNLKIDFLFEKDHDKMPAFQELQKKSGLAPGQMAYVGDDLPDIPLLKLAGFAATVPEAVDSVKESVHYVTGRPGGNGAVREVCDIILRYGALA